MWCWRQWGSMSTATSMCWGCARARPRTPRQCGPCWPIWWSAGSIPTVLLIVIDGAKALHKAVVEVFGAHGLIQRCREHKKRNVTDALPERLRAAVRSAMNQAYATRDTKRARRLLEGLARRLEHQHPGAASSLREGLEETLTVMRLGLPENLERVLPPPT